MSLPVSVPPLYFHEVLFFWGVFWGFWFFLGSLGSLETIVSLNSGLLTESFHFHFILVRVQLFLSLKQRSSAGIFFIISDFRLLGSVIKFKCIIFRRYFRCYHLPLKLRSGIYYFSCCSSSSCYFVLGTCRNLWLI